MPYKDLEKAKACRKAYQKVYQKAYREANKEKINATAKAYYQANQERILAHKKAYREANKEKISLLRKASDRAYREANKEKISLHKKAYYQANKEKINATAKAYREANKEKIRADNKVWYQKNREKRIAWALTYQNNRRKTDPTYRLIKNMRSRINGALKGKNKSKSTMQLIGCTIDELWLHLEKQFYPHPKTGKPMTRENHGFGEDYWHVDHYKPCAKFDLSDPEQQKICFRYTNLQPLWQTDNFSKGAKFDG